MDKSKIKCVIFDLGGTIIDQTLLFQDGNNRMITLPGTFREQYELIRNSEMAEQMEKGEIRLSEYVKYVFEKIPPELQHQMKHVHDNFEFENLTVMATTPNPFLRQDMLKLVEDLSSSGFKTALLTNTLFTDDQQQESLNLCPRHNFDVVIESCRVGMRKPEPQIYKHLLEKLRLQPEQCLYVDESETNCAGAQAVGIKSVQICDEKETIENIHQLLGL